MTDRNERPKLRSEARWDVDGDGGRRSDDSGSRGESNAKGLIISCSRQLVAGGCHRATRARRGTGGQGHGRAAWPLASRPRAKWSAATATASWPYPGLGRRPSYGDGPAAWPGGPGQVTCREAAYAPASC